MIVLKSFLILMDIQVHIFMNATQIKSENYRASQTFFSKTCFGNFGDPPPHRAGVNNWWTTNTFFMDPIYMDIFW